MDFSAVGKKIKELRKQIKLSQGELAEGICTQAQISKIEKGDVYPYASTLYLISQRLGVDVNYFFDIGMTPRLDYVEEVIYQLKLARRNMNYTEMYQLVRTEENNPLFTQHTKNHQLLLWHKGIYQYEVKGDVGKAVSLIEEGLALTQINDKMFSEREIEMTSSMGVIYLADRQYEKSYATFQDALLHIKSLPHVSDKTVKTRLYYNFARLLTRMDQYDESIAYCQKAIKWCLEQDQLYLLAELHYQLGYNLELQENYTEACANMKKSIFLFEMQKDDRFPAFIKKKLDSWIEEKKIEDNLTIVHLNR